MSFLLRTNSLNFSLDLPFSLNSPPLGKNHGVKFSRPAERARLVLCSRDGLVGEVGLAGERTDRAVISEHGWSVRRLRETESEKRRVAYVQAKAFHLAMPLFDDLFFDFFKAEVFAALIYRLKNSPADRYCCLVAEADRSTVSDRVTGFSEEVVGVVDLTVMRDDDVMRHLNGDEEYVYVSGIAVLHEFRRRKMGTILMKACDMVCTAWGYNSLALRAYEEDLGAQELYYRAGYRVVSRDPIWMTSFGRKRRVLMIKKLSW